MGKHNEQVDAHMNPITSEYEERCCTGYMRRNKTNLKENKARNLIFKWQEFQFEHVHICTIFVLNKAIKKLYKLFGYGSTTFCFFFNNMIQ